jgi:predicted RNA-binding protein with PUA-like domain
MAYWLLKTEPDVFGWPQQVAVGARGEPWTGVRNPAARAHLRAMAVGDEALFYHTGDERAAVGVVVVIKPVYPDPTDPTGAWVCVDVAAVRPLGRPVTLAAIKASPSLADIALVRQPRLSVQPLSAEAWAAILALE